MEQCRAITVFLAPNNLKTQGYLDSGFCSVLFGDESSETGGVIAIADGDELPVVFAHSKAHVDELLGFANDSDATTQRVIQQL